MPFNLFVQDRSGELIGAGIEKMGEGIANRIDKGKQYATDAKALDTLVKSHPELAPQGYDEHGWSNIQKSQAFQGAIKNLQVGAQLAQQQQAQAEAARFNAQARIINQEADATDARLNPKKKDTTNPLIESLPLGSPERAAAEAQQEETKAYDLNVRGKAAILSAMSPDKAQQLAIDRKTYQALAQQYQATFPSADLVGNASGMTWGQAFAPNNPASYGMQSLSKMQLQDMNKEAAKARAQIGSSMKDLQAKYSDRDLLTMPDQQYDNLHTFIQQVAAQQQQNNVIDAIKSIGTRGITFGSN